MIDWVADRCDDWAQQYRAMGWPTLAELDTFNYTHDPLIFTPEAAEVSRAVFRMRTIPKMELPHRVLITNYLFAGAVKVKLQALDMDKFTYWRTGLHAAHCFLAASIEQPMKQSA